MTKAACALGLIAMVAASAAYAGMPQRQRSVETRAHWVMDAARDGLYAALLRRDRVGLDSLDVALRAAQGPAAVVTVIRVDTGAADWRVIGDVKAEPDALRAAAARAMSAPRHSDGAFIWLNYDQKRPNAMSSVACKRIFAHDMLCAVAVER